MVEVGFGLLGKWGVPEVQLKELGCLGIPGEELCPG